tara:strand:- start:473 stop:757 length:285 start_codon:yes stop_codon:yes gene_type:complete
MRPLSTPGQTVLEEDETSSARIDSHTGWRRKKIRTANHHKLREQHGLNRENLSLFKLLDRMEFDDCPEKVYKKPSHFFLPLNAADVAPGSISSL